MLVQDGDRHIDPFTQFFLRPATVDVVGDRTATNGVKRDRRWTARCLIDGLGGLTVVDHSVVGAVVRQNARTGDRHERFVRSLARHSAIDRREQRVTPVVILHVFPLPLDVVNQRFSQRLRDRHVALTRVSVLQRCSRRLSIAELEDRVVPSLYEVVYVQRERAADATARVPQGVEKRVIPTPVLVGLQIAKHVFGVIESECVVTSRLFVREVWHRHFVGQSLLDQIDGFAPANEDAEVLHVVVESDNLDVLTPALLLPTLDDVPGYVASRFDLVFLAELDEMFRGESVRTNGRVLDDALLGGEELPSCLPWRYDLVNVLVWVGIHWHPQPQHGDDRRGSSPRTTPVSALAVR